MREDVRQLYRGVLIQISENLTEEQYKELLFYCKDHIPKRSLSISQAPFTSVEVFGRLEDAEIISWENLSFLKEFARAIRRQDLVTELTSFEITRELTIYALKRQGLGASSNLSAASVGHHLAELMDLADLVQDGVAVPARGLIKSRLQSGQNVSNILEDVEKALPVADSGRNWRTLALLVTIAAEIVLVAFNVNRQQEHSNKYALKLSRELANHLSYKVAKLGSWVSEFIIELRLKYFQ